MAIPHPGINLTQEGKHCRPSVGEAGQFPVPSHPGGHVVPALEAGELIGRAVLGQCT